MDGILYIAHMAIDNSVILAIICREICESFEMHPSSVSVSYFIVRHKYTCSTKKEAEEWAKFWLKHIGSRTDLRFKVNVNYRGKKKGFPKKIQIDRQEMKPADSNGDGEEGRER